MISDSTLNKTKPRIKYFYSKSQMLLIKLKEQFTTENKERYFDVLDSLDNELDKYYSNYMMLLKTNDSILFETYLALKKESVKTNLLSELLKEWNIERKESISINEIKFNIHTELKK